MHHVARCHVKVKVRSFDHCIWFTWLIVMLSWHAVALVNGDPQTWNKNIDTLVLKKYINMLVVFKWNYLVAAMWFDAMLTENLGSRKNLQRVLLVVMCSWSSSSLNMAIIAAIISTVKCCPWTKYLSTSCPVSSMSTGEPNCTHILCNKQGKYHDMKILNSNVC